MKNGIITLAVGKEFNKMAKYLGFSLILNSPSIIRAIITDNPKYFENIFDLIIPYSKDMGNPLFVKLNIHHYSPFYKSLFIDADTLVYTDLRFMWDYFEDKSIICVGNCLTEGNWHDMDIANALNVCNIPWIAKINSGVFLFKKDKIGMAALDFAVELHKNHEGIEIPFFREKMLPHEPFFGLAMGKYNQVPINPTDDHGRLGRSYLRAKKIRLDITRGISIFTKYNKKKWGGGKEIVFPSIVHYTGGPLGELFYWAEKLNLLFYFKGIPGYLFVNYFTSIFKIFLNFIKYFKQLLTLKSNLEL